MNKTINEKKLTSKEKRQILESIRSGLQEVKAAKEGKIKLQSARGFLNEMRN